MTAAQRFWAKVAVSRTACWMWTGACSGYGHGRFWDGERLVLAHRWVLGDLPAGSIVRHTCDNPACVRPDHLQIGTHADNVRDKVQRGRQPRGEHFERSQLTVADVLHVRSEVAAGPRGTASRLAREYGVTRSTIRDIVSHRTWSHVA